MENEHKTLEGIKPYVLYYHFCPLTCMPLSKKHISISDIAVLVALKAREEERQKYEEERREEEISKNLEMLSVHSRYTFLEKLYELKGLVI